MVRSSAAARRVLSILLQRVWLGREYVNCATRGCTNAPSQADFWLACCLLVSYWTLGQRFFFLHHGGHCESQVRKASRDDGLPHCRVTPRTQASLELPENVLT